MKATDFIFVGVFENDSEHFMQAVERAGADLGFEIHVYPALGLNVACCQMLFALETKKNSYNNDRLANLLRREGFDVKPFCMELFTPLSRDVVANSCLAELTVLKGHSLLISAWTLINDLSEEVSSANGDGLNFVVIDLSEEVSSADGDGLNYAASHRVNAQDSPFVAVIWSREGTANFDYWQKWMFGKMRNISSKFFFHRVFIHK